MYLCCFHEAMSKSENKVKVQIETFRNVIPIGIITCWTKIRGKKPSLYFKYFWPPSLQSENLLISAHKLGIELKQQCQVGSWKKKMWISKWSAAIGEKVHGNRVKHWWRHLSEEEDWFHVPHWPYNLRRWPRPDINFRMKHEMSDNNSVNFWRTKMVHPFLEFPVQGLWSQHWVIGALESSVYTKSPP